MTASPPGTSIFEASVDDCFGASRAVPAPESERQLWVRLAGLRSGRSLPLAAMPAHARDSVSRRAKGCRHRRFPGRGFIRERAGPRSWSVSAARAGDGDCANRNAAPLRAIGAFRSDVLRNGG